MDRFLVNTPASISATWYSGGVIIDPGTVTVTVERADGTLVVSGTATGSGANPKLFNLTAIHTGALDKLKSTWVSATKGTLVNYHEIVGDFLFTISDGLALMPTSTAADIAAARVRAEQELEDACGVAFVPRYDRETVSGERSRTLLLRRSFVRNVRSVAIDGILLNSTELAKVEPDGHMISYENGFTCGVRNITVEYEHGFDNPPGGADRAALRLARRVLVPDSYDDRIVSASAGEESFTFASRYRDSTKNRSPYYGIPEVDNFISANDYRVTVG